jgi:hypothetical protein
MSSPTKRTRMPLSFSSVSSQMPKSPPPRVARSMRWTASVSKSSFSIFRWISFV